MHITVYKIDNQQDNQYSYCIAQEITQYSVIICGERIWKRIDTCICIIKSICYTSETNKTV